MEVPQVLPAAEYMLQESLLQYWASLSPTECGCVTVAPEIEAFKPHGQFVLPGNGRSSMRSVL